MSEDLHLIEDEWMTFLGGTKSRVLKASRPAHPADSVMRRFAAERRAKGRELGDLFREQIDKAKDFDDLLVRLKTLEDGAHLVELAESLARASLDARASGMKHGR